MKTMLKKAIHHLLCLLAYGQSGCASNLSEEAKAALPETKAEAALGGKLHQSEAIAFYPKPMLF